MAHKQIFMASFRIAVSSKWPQARRIQPVGKKLWLGPSQLVESYLITACLADHLRE